MIEKTNVTEIEVKLGSLTSVPQVTQEKIGDNLSPPSTNSKMAPKPKTTQGEPFSSATPRLVDGHVVETEQGEHEVQNDPNVPLVQVSLMNNQMEMIKLMKKLLLRFYWIISKVLRGRKLLRNLLLLRKGVRIF